MYIYTSSCKVRTITFVQSVAGEMESLKADYTLTVSVLRRSRSLTHRSWGEDSQATCGETTRFYRHARSPLTTHTEQLPLVFSAWHDLTVSHVLVQQYYFVLIHVLGLHGLLKGMW